jgi:hypothetical protein
MASTTSGWSPNTVLVQDGIHPTPKGEAFIAFRVAQALHDGGWLRSAPATPPASVPWVRNLRPKVVLRGESAVLSWDAQGLTSADIWARRRRGSWRLLGTTAQRSFTYRLTPGATYDVKIQGIRRVMRSTLSTATTVTGPALGQGQQGAGSPEEGQVDAGARRHAVARPLPPAVRHRLARQVRQQDDAGRPGRHR